MKNKDIVFARSGATVGKSFLIENPPEKSVFASYLIRIQLIAPDLAGYLIHFFNSTYYWKQIMDKSTGSGQPNCNGTKLSQLIVPLPPFHEAIQIEKKINEVLPFINAIQSEKESLAKYVEKAKAKILEKIFSEDSSYKSYYLENKTTLLELIPKEKIGDGDWVLSSDMDENGDYSLVQLKHIGNGMYLDKDYCRVNNVFFSNHNCSEIKENYILINRIVSETMNVCLLPALAFKTITSVDVCWIAPDENLYNQKYLMYLLMSPQFQQRVMLLCSGSTRQRISKKKLTNIAFKIHKRKIQDCIVCDIEDKLSLLNLLSA